MCCWKHYVHGKINEKSRPIEANDSLQIRNDTLYNVVTLGLRFLLLQSTILMGFKFKKIINKMLMFIKIFLPLDLAPCCLVLLDANLLSTTCLVPDEYLSALQQPVCWNNVALTHSHTHVLSSWGTTSCEPTSNATSQQQSNFRQHF